jgi:hypothetical protein
MSQQQPTSGQVEPAQMQAFMQHILQQMDQQHAQQLAIQQQMAQIQSAQGAAQAAPPQSHYQNSVPALEHNLARHLRRPKGFSGQEDDNPSTWCSQVDTYFQLAGILDDATRINMTGMLLEKAALLWWTQRKRNLPEHDMSWEAFKEALKTRFRPIETAKISRAKLYKLKQNSCKDLGDYTEQFQVLMENITDMAVTDQIDRYRLGLVFSLQKELVQKDFLSLAEIMSAAAKIDIMEKQVHSHLQNKGRFGGSPQTSTQYRNGYTAPRAQQSGGGAPSTSAPMELGNINNNDRVPGLSKEEFTRLRSEGKCFRCKKTGHIANRCPTVTSKPGGSFRKPHGRVNAVEETEQEGQSDNYEADESLNSQPQ